MTAAGGDGSSRGPEVTTSPRIERLRAELGGAGEPAVLGSFWREIAAAGTPLIESDGQTLTFLWRDRHGTRPGTREVVLIANRLTDPSARARSVLERIEGTDVWHRSYRVPGDLRLTYQFAPVDGIGTPVPVEAGPARRWQPLAAELVPDPLNPRRFPQHHGGAASAVVELAGESRWTARNANVPAGTLRERSVPSAALGAPRRVWVHEPAQAAHPAVLLVVLDGDDWIGRLGGPAILDNLAAARAIPPTITLFVDAIDRPTRIRDLSPESAFLDFLSDELVEWVRRTRGTDVPRAAIAGQSLGGLTALAAAARRDGPFSAVVAQSSSLWWVPESARGEREEMGGESWLAERWAATGAGRAARRVHLEVGRLEWMLIPRHRRLAAKARAGGDVVTYSEFSGGHEALCWRAGLGDALVAVLADTGTREASAPPG